MKNVKLLLATLAAGLAFSIQAHAAGAIVVNDEEGAGPADYAMVSYATSWVQASEDALSDCRGRGLRSCVVLARFQQCGALALSDKFYRVGEGATAAQAMSRALEKCPGCRVAQVACEDPRESHLVSTMP